MDRPRSPWSGIMVVPGFPILMLRPIARPVYDKYRKAGKITSWDEAVLFRPMARCVWNFAGLSVLLDFGRIHSRNWARLGFSPRVKVMLALTEAATSWAIPVVALRTRWLLEDKPRVMTAIRDMRKESLQYWDAPRAKTPGPQVFEEEVWSGDWPADKTEGDLAASDRRSP